jgi:hypothetical protein
MRATGEQIERNQIGLAMRGQKQILLDVQKIIEILVGKGQEGKAQPSSEAVALPNANGGRKAKPSEMPTASPSDRAAPAAAGVTGLVQPHKPDMETARATMQRLWGQLPEHVRQKMLQTPIEDFPPKYERMIEEYYRRLSEENMEK